MQQSILQLRRGSSKWKNDVGIITPQSQIGKMSSSHKMCSF
jgi:hypothetical protein